MRDRVGDREDGEDITTVLFYISMREELNAEVQYVIGWVGQAFVGLVVIFLFLD